MSAAAPETPGLPFESEAAAMRYLMDSLPIHATKIGYRTTSTPEERALGDALFRVHERWLEVRPS